MRRSLLLAVVAAAILAGCASPSDDDLTAEPTVRAADASDYDLRLQVDRGDGTPAEEWTLTCVGRVSGTHPDPGAACTHLAGLDDPFAPLAPGVCTQQYGGPQTAHVTGRWSGEPVDLQLARADGCLIAQWDRLGPLLPIPVG